MHTKREVVEAAIIGFAVGAVTAPISEWIVAIIASLIFIYGLVELIRD